MCPNCGGVGVVDADDTGADLDDRAFTSRVLNAAEEWLGPDRALAYLAGIATTVFLAAPTDRPILDDLDLDEQVVVAEIVEAIRAAVDWTPVRCSYRDDDITCVAPATSQVRSWPHGEWQDCCQTHHEAITAAAITDSLATPPFPSLEAPT